MVFHDSVKKIKNLDDPVRIFKALETLAHWPYLPLKPHFLKELPDTDGWIIPGTKMTNTY